MKKTKKMHTVLTDENFPQEVLEYPGVVLVEFVADWCGYCQIMAPVVRRVVSDKQDRIKTGKLDVDENLQTAREYAIRTLPTIIFFQNGKIVDHVTGVVPEKVIAAKLEAILKLKKLTH